MTMKSGTTKGLGRRCGYDTYDRAGSHVVSHVWKTGREEEHNWKYQAGDK